MNPEQKLRYFNMLVAIGFKQIELSFPSASKDDFDFVRRLVDGGLVPDDVVISVLTQARAPLIARTVESLAGVRKAILHMYVATSDLHAQIVFGKSRSELLAMAVDGTREVVERLRAAGLWGRVGFEFSPEEFTDTDLSFAIDVCEAVKSAWGPSSKGDFILNLPATVERRPPYQYADMIESFIGRYSRMDETTISVHAHNDQGCAVAATEMAVLAGAERVEGTLFGHGERTGNVDLVTFALNLESRSIRTGLDFSNLPEVVRVVEEVTGIDVHPRHPYAGELVFTAFSGSHQDAIRKGMADLHKARALFHADWKVPYLHINPASIGRTFERIIRINSQSGKGGVAFVLEREYGIHLPKSYQPEMGRHVQALADEKGSEINAADVLALFERHFLDVQGPYTLVWYRRAPELAGMNDEVGLEARWLVGGVEAFVSGVGNGPISAMVHALQKADVIPFTVDDYSEQALGHGEDASALAYITVKSLESGRLHHGAGRDSNIDKAAFLALMAALNKAYNAERAGLST